METISLSQFVAERGGSAEAAEKLVHRFDTPPPMKYFPKSKYVSEAYNDAELRKTVGLVWRLLQGMMARVTLEEGRTPAGLRKDVRWFQDTFGFCTDAEGSKQIAMKRQLYGLAARFAFSSIGTCSARSSFAAMQLREMISDKDCQVYVRS